jgi:general secretion pathway protein D
VKSVLQTSLLVAAMVVLAGCATMRPIPPARLDLPMAPPPVAADDVHSRAPMPASAPAGEFDPDVANGRLVRPGSGDFINKQVAGRAPDPAGKPGEVSFNFEGESLHAVIKGILGEFLQENYVIAPGVQGTVTFSTARPMRADQAMSILEMLLRWNNATLVWEDGRYTILPVGQAIPGNLTPRTGSAARARGYEVRAVPLQYISPIEMERVLKPYAKPEAIVNIDPARNMIVLAGTRAELENYLETIEIFDVDWLAGMSVGVFTLQQAEASKVVGELEKIFGEGSNTPLAGMFRFMPMEGINGVLVITPQPRYLATIQEWLERFDLGGGEAGQRLYVYDVKNVKAADLAATLTDIFSSGGGRTSVRPSGAVAPGLEPVEIRSMTGRVGEPPRGEVQRQERQAQRAERAERRMADAEAGFDPGLVGAPGVVDAAGGISLGATDEVRITAVEESNALLIRATSGQWESIRRVIDRLDQIPLQVVIEAQIVQVDLIDELSFGVQWFFEHGIADANLRADAAARNAFSGIGGAIGANPGGATWSFIGRDAFAVLTALDTKSNITVLSAPSIVVLNNKQATINSGQSIPVSTTQIGNPIGGGAMQPVQNFQYLQTGITMRVTPRVNPGGLVFLEIEQEDSTPGPLATAVGGNRSVDTRNISTEVAVQSGETVVLGGLIKQSDTAGSSGLPFVSRVPILGSLFGNRARQSSRQELLVLITPRVVRNPAEARRITEEYKSRFRGLQPLRPAESP